MTRQRSSSVQLRVEALDDRLLPAANLTTTLNHGMLAVTDWSINTSVVVREANQRFSVDGVNGSSAAAQVSSISIWTPFGRDTVRITGAEVRGQQYIVVPVSINTGAGHDTLLGVSPSDVLRDPQLTGGAAMHCGSVQLWLQMGGATGVLGMPRGNEQPAADRVGFITYFQGGAIYWSNVRGAHETHGQIYLKWLQTGGERGPLGEPVTNELQSADGQGRIGYFQGGAIYWTARTGARETHGLIYQKWLQMGGERSPLGEPISNELPSADGQGRISYFQGGAIYWNPGLGAVETHGLIYRKWLQTGGEQGPLGEPLTDEKPSADGLGRISYFQGGAIYWTAQSGAHEVQGAIYQTWLQMDGERSALGEPVSDEQAANAGGGRISYFRAGNMYWSPSTGTQVTENSDPWAAFENFDHTLSDPTLAAIVRARTLDDGQLSRGDVLDLLWAEESVGSVSALQLADLRAVAAHAGLENMTDDVANLLGKVVGANVANASYQGGPLGNLYAGSGAAQLANLIDKWFLGGDLPAADPNSTYVNAAGTLFGPNGPQYSDVVQGAVGDCYFLSALAEVALQNPSVLENSIIDNGDGTFTVRFNMAGEGQAPQWDYVTVNSMLPAYVQLDGDGNPTGTTFAYANNGQDTTSGGNVLWVALYEKAYAQLAEEGWSRGPGAANAYDAINVGDPVVTMLQIGGVTTRGESIGPDTAADVFAQLTDGLASGQWVNICTPEDEPDPNVVGFHCYAVLGYDADSGLFTIYNPWGFSQQISWDDLQNDFSWLAVTA
jgi:uncharacterized protein with LGFP repeats